MPFLILRLPELATWETIIDIILFSNVLDRVLLVMDRHFALVLVSMLNLHLELLSYLCFFIFVLKLELLIPFWERVNCWLYSISPSGRFVWKTAQKINFHLVIKKYQPLIVMKFVICYFWIWCFIDNICTLFIFAFLCRIIDIWSSCQWLIILLKKCPTVDLLLFCSCSYL